MSDPTAKIAELERQIKIMAQQLYELNKRVAWLERENTRRRVEIQQKKG
jgi:regulator of replication initiation timing